MEPDLLDQILRGLKGRSRTDLQAMADRLKGKKVSFSLLYHLSRGKYPSIPTYDRVAAIARDLKSQRKARAA